MKKRQGSPLVRVWTVVAALIAVAGIVVALARPAWAEQTHTVTITTDDEASTVLYKKDAYALGKTRISALGVLKKAGVANPGKVHEVKLEKDDSGVVSSTVSGEDVLFVVKKEAKKVVLTVTYGDARTEAKFRLSCEANQTSSNDVATAVESNAPPANEERASSDTANTTGAELANASGEGSLSAQDGEHAVSVTTDSSESGDAWADVEQAEEGTTVILTARANRGWQFSGWEVSTAGVELADATAVSTTFSMPDSDVEVKATFAKIYSVTVDTDGHGTASADSYEGTEGTAVLLSATPSGGYEFKEWQLVSGTGASISGDTLTIGTSDVEVKAIFEEAPAYSVTMDDDGNGTASADPTEGAEGAEIGLTATPNSGYRFKEWQIVYGKDATISGDTLTIGTSDVVIKATFEAINVTITFNANGGRGSMDPITGQAGVGIKLPGCSFTRSGYGFIGWNTKADGSGDALAAGKSYKFPRDYTLYAQWSDTATISFDANGGTGSMESITKERELDDSKAHITLPRCSFSRSGKGFSGWNTKADGTGQALTPGKTYKFDKDYTLYAQWGDPVTITFNKNASNATGTMSRQVVAKGDKVLLDENLYERSGWKFVGWNTSAAGDGDSYAADKSGNCYGTFNENTTLYAQWESENFVTITFDANGGTGSMDPIAKEKELDEGKMVAKIKLPECTFTRSGYSFSGWNTKADGSGQALNAGTTYKFPKDYALYAQWKKGSGNEVTISFDANGGTGSMDAVTGKKGEAITLPSCSFTRSGYRFTGWNTKADGSGQALKAGGTYKFPGDYTLYAQWAEGSEVTISFDANGGEGEMADITAKVGDAVKLPANEFTNDGYYFVGWNTKADGSGQALESGKSYKFTSDYTLYAQWKEGSNIETKNPVVTTNVGGSWTSKTTEITFTISQEIPLDATYARIWFDLDDVLYYTVNSDQIGVHIKEGNAIDGVRRAIDGQHLEIVIDDDTAIKGLRGKTVLITFKAKIRDGADLAAYEKEESGVAYIPFEAFAEFNGAEERTVESGEKNLRIRYSGTTDNSSTRTGSTTTTSAKKSSTLAKTADPTSMAAVVTMALSGAGLALTGLRRRK